MYSERKDTFSIKDIVLQVLFIILFVFILIWLFPMKGDLKQAVKEIKGAVAGISVDSGNNSALTAQIFGDNITKMKEAAKSYYTDERLPKSVGSKVSMTLGDMMDKHLLVKLVDGNNGSCDLEESYVEVTKLDKEYQMKVNLSCTDASDYIIEHMGCYTYCQTAICEAKKATGTGYTYVKSGSATPASSKPSTSKSTTAKKVPAINFVQKSNVSSGANTGKNTGGSSGNNSNNNMGSGNTNSSGNNQGGIVIGGGTVDNSNSNNTTNSNNVTNNYYSNTTKWVNKETEWITLYSVPWVRTTSSTHSFQATLNIPSELKNKDDIRNVELSEVQYVAPMTSQSQLNTTINNHTVWYDYAGSSYDYPYSQWKSIYLAKNVKATPRISGNRVIGFSLTFTSNSSSQAYVVGGAKTMIAGFQYRVKWSYQKEVQA